MNYELIRSLTVSADGEILTGFCHARLTGRDSIGLYPMPFCLKLWNLPDGGYYQLSAAKEVSVLHHDSVLASGSISDVYRKTVPEGTVTEIVFAAGLGLWETPVSLSVEAGVSVSETVRRLLEASGTGVSLLGFEGEDPVRTRGQAFCGSAAYCIGTALSAAGARCCLVPAGLCVIPASGLPVSLVLSEADLIDPPVSVGKGQLLLRTRLTGWPLGKTASVSWKGKAMQGLVIERSVDADNMEGNWQSELLIQIQN